MKISNTLYELGKEIDQRNLMTTLQNGSDSPQEFNTIRAVGPNHKFPEPWIIEKFPGSNWASIISVGGEVDETIVSMMPLEIAEKVMKELEDE